MRVAFDTNVLLDTILKRPERAAALQLMRAVAEDKVTGVVSANSITDLYYVSKKGIGDKAAREAVSDILSMFDVAVVDGDVCSMALMTDMKDFEDALLAVCAAREEADYIVTRDAEFIRGEGCPVPAVSPADLLGVIREQDHTI
jgi:predicted nucleic acid-binding protein